MLLFYSVPSNHFLATHRPPKDPLSIRVSVMTGLAGSMRASRAVGRLKMEVEVFTCTTRNLMSLPGKVETITPSGQ